MSERVPIVYSDTERSKVLYASSYDAVFHAKVLLWPPNHIDHKKNFEMVPFLTIT